MIDTLKLNLKKKDYSMAVKIYRVLKFTDKKGTSLKMINSLKKSESINVKFDQKKIDKGLIPQNYLKVQYKLENYTNLNGSLHIKEKGIKKTFAPKKFVGKFRHQKIWNDNNKTQIKPYNEVFSDFEIPVAFFIKNGYLHALILKADSEMVKKFTTLYPNAEEIKSNQFNNNLFNWLFYLYDEKKGKIQNDNKITDMLGFTSSPSGTNLDLEVISGMSSHVAGLDATKLEIALNHTLTSIKLTIIYKSKMLSFSIDDNLKMVINPQFTNLESAFSENYSSFEKIHYDMARGIYILCIVIPYLEKELSVTKNFDNLYKSYRLRLRDILVLKLQNVQ